MQAEQGSYSNCQFANDYKLYFLLGEGGQASVYLGSKGNKLYALKIYAQGMNKEEAFKREVEFLQNLKHPYLISIVDSHPSAQVKLKDSEVQQRAIIALQFAEAELFDFIAKEGRFSPQICRTLFRQLIQAIKFLEERGVTHRDLKPQNILFDKCFNFKVSDFGLSTFSEGHDKDGVLYSRVGTQGYKPPEMEQGKYTGLQADLFAAGVILFVMYNGSPPFMSTKPIDKIYRLIRDKNFSKFWSLHQKKKPQGFYPDSFKRLMNQFFSVDPAKRPTLDSLSEDQWLNNDYATADHLRQYMQKRYDNIAVDDEVKKKIAKIRKQMLQHQMIQEQDQSKQSKDSNNRGKQVNLFVQRAKQFRSTKIQSLPETQKNITYFCKDLGFVLAFLNDYVDQCLQNKNVFMEDFLQDIQPADFEMITQGNQIKLTFVFDVDEQAEETLKITGKLYQKEGKFVGIDWVKQQGNDFWLSSIIRNLSQRLQVLV